MKIDYMMTRKQAYLVPLLFIVALVMGQNTAGEELSLLVVSSYMLFISSIFSTTPFAYNVGKNKGFLLLFPATVKDRVAGRFLYGLSFLGFLGLLCGTLVGVNMLRGIRTPLWMLGLVLCCMAVGIVLMALEFLFFYLFGEGKDNWQYLSNFVRVVPGMALFFCLCHLVGVVEDEATFDMWMQLGDLSGKFLQIGVIAVVAALLLTAAAVAVCVKVIEKRDYA